MQNTFRTFLDHLNATRLNIYKFLSTHNSSDMLDMLPVHDEKVVGLIIMACLCGLVSLMLFITVCKDRCIRNQIMGFLLINISVAVFLFDLAGILPRIETEITHMTSIGKIGCNFVYQIYHVSMIEFVVVLVLLGRDSAIFTYDKRSHSNKSTFVKYTILSWAFSYICVLIGFEVVANGFEFVAHENATNEGSCVLKPFEYTWMTFYVYNFLVMYLLPGVTVAFLTIFLIYLSYCRTIEPSYKVNHMSFILSGIVFVFFGMHYYITFFYYENGDVSKLNTYRSTITFIFSLLKDFAKPLICIIWLFTVPELRSSFLCKRQYPQDQDDEETMKLLETK